MFCYFLGFLALGCGGRGTERSGKVPGPEPVERESGETAPDPPKILFFGNSLTAGYGLGPGEAFPALIQRRLDSLDMDYRVVNAGLSGETTASGRNRLAWVLDQEVSLVVIELGANDGLRGIPLEETRKNLQAMVDMVQEELPRATIVLAGMQLPPNMGQEYTSGFREIYPRLAEREGISLIPFLLEGVGGVPELNQGDGIHPTAEGHRMLAENVWEVIKDLL